MTNMYGKDITRIEAYDGNFLHTYADISVPQNQSASRAEMACTLSHIKAMRTAYQAGEAGVLVMEDDIHPTYRERWEHTLKDIVQMKPADAQCVTLFCINAKVTMSLWKLPQWFVPLRKDHWGAGCYYVSREGMACVLNTYIRDERICLPPSSSQLIADQGALYPLMRTYHYTRPLFINECADSYIHPHHLPGHRQNHRLIQRYFRPQRKRKHRRGQGGRGAKKRSAAALS